MLIDTHAHLDDAAFADDLPAVLDRAKAAGVARVIAIGTSAKSSETCLRLARDHDMVYASVGIHPNHAVTDTREGDWDRIVQLAGGRKVVALGETGLDRHWDFTPPALQRDYFARHLELSRKTGLPVVIHCREAEDDVAAMLQADYEKLGPLRGVLHSFAGDQAFADAGLAVGLYISFAGMLTYKNAEVLRKVAAGVPLHRLLVETDSPYLTPVPLRGKEKRNEPAHIVHTARCLAQVKGLPLETVAERATENARRLFGIPV
jgi:TatD DNase family protein